MRLKCTPEYGVRQAPEHPGRNRDSVRNRGIYRQGGALDPASQRRQSRRQPAHGQEEDNQHSAGEHGMDKKCKDFRPAEPQGRGREQFGVAPTYPAWREQGETDHQRDEATQQMIAGLAQPSPAASAATGKVRMTSPLNQFGMVKLVAS